MIQSQEKKNYGEGSVVIKGHLMNKVFALITAKKGGHFQRKFYLNHSEKDKFGFLLICKLFQVIFLGIIQRYIWIC